MITFIQITVLFVFLVGGCLLFRRLPPKWSALAWIVVPVLLTPLWLQIGKTHHWSWFLWAKTWSVILACAWFAYCAARPTMSPRFVAVTVHLFLGLNIFEAVVMDWSRGAPVNAIAGLVLIASLALVRTPRVEADASRAEITIDLGWSWIAAYSVWNACFVYGTFTHAFGHHIAVLSAALVLARRFGQASWLIIRTTTLGLYLVVYDSFFGYGRYGFDTSAWRHSRVIAVFCWVSLACALGAAAILVRAKYRRDPRVKK